MRARGTQVRRPVRKGRRPGLHLARSGHMQWYPEVTGQCLCHNVNIEFVHARHEEFLLATYRGSGTMRQEIRLDIVFPERLKLFERKQLFDARGKLPDPVERQRIGETYLEHSSRKPKLLQGINDIVERAAHCNDPH